jgi:hypothetical protein
MTSSNPIAKQRASVNFQKALEKFSNAIGAKNPGQSENPYQASYAIENPERFLQEKANPQAIHASQRQATRESYADAIDASGRANLDAMLLKQQAGAADFNQRERERFTAVQMANQKVSQGAGGGNSGGGDSEGRERSYAPSQSSELIGGGVRQVVRADGIISQQMMFDPASKDRTHQKNMTMLESRLGQQRADKDAYNQRLLSQQQATAGYQQQAAQNQAQERLARIGQQASIYQSMFGNAGESSWRWF